MEIVTVIPIARGIFKEELTYFTTLSVEPGAIVTVPVQNRAVEALVTIVQSAAEVKASVRSADFPLKKILRIKYDGFFTPAFLSAARRAADHFVGTLGQTLKSLVPTQILTGSPFIIRRQGLSLRTCPKDSPCATVEKYVLQEPGDERLIYYKGMVREEFARGASIFLCLPTIADIKRAFESLERGINDYTITFHHALGRKTLLDSWQKALTIKHPILIIGTPMFLALPRPDLGTIIIDQESSPAYKALGRPYLDYRVFAEMLAESGGWRFVLGDFVLRTETIYRLDQGVFQTKTSIKHHAVSNAEQRIIRVASAPGRLRVLSEELIEQLAAASQNNERFFLYVHRRGLTPLVLCQDCGAAVTCRNCEAPLSWHEARLTPACRRGRDGQENFFLCHHCGARRSAAEKCAVCGGWRLLGLGIGIDLVAKELAARLPVKIFKLDSDQVKNERQANSTVKKFLETPGGVLIGTEMAMYYFRERIENAAVAAIDSLFALPDYRVNERVFNILIRLRTLASKRFLIQTRNVRNELFDLASRGSLLDFYRQELAERRTYGYPPFRLFIKITLAGVKNEVLPAMKALEHDLDDYEFDTFSPVTGQKNDYVINLLLRLPTDQWPNNPHLLEILKSLPPQYIINVDPENLLN